MNSSLPLNSKFTLYCLLWEDWNGLLTVFPLPVSRMLSFVNRQHWKHTEKERCFLSWFWCSFSAQLRKPGKLLQHPILLVYGGQTSKWLAPSPDVLLGWFLEECTSRETWFHRALSPSPRRVDCQQVSPMWHHGFLSWPYSPLQGLNLHP